MWELGPVGGGFTQMLPTWSTGQPQAAQQAIRPGRDQGQLSPGRAWPLTVQGLFWAFHYVGFLDSLGYVLVPRLHF